MKQYSKAEDYYLQALAIYKQILQGADSVRMAKPLNNLAAHYTHMKHYDKAEKYYQRGLSRYRKFHNAFIVWI